MTPLQQLEKTIQPLVTQIAEHRVFQAITSIEKLCRFAEMHVFAVYDFMCLIKELQRRLSCMDILWLPPQNYLGCHLINHLVAEEESDTLNYTNLDSDSGSNSNITTECYLSHFDLYLKAMHQCGSNTQPILQFIADIREKSPLPVILIKPYIPPAAKNFMADTFKVIGKQAVHAVATSFAFARENITADMFTPIMQNLGDYSEKINLFITYFQRHIELDSGKHGEQAKLLVESLCGNDAHKWEQATQTAVFSLKSRIQLLNGIYKSMEG